MVAKHASMELIWRYIFNADRSFMIQNTRKPLRLMPVAEYLIYKIYDATMNNDRMSKFSLSDIEGIVSADIPRNLLLNAIELLREYRAGGVRLLVRHGRKENYQFSITRDGILEVEQSINRGDSIAAFLLKQPDADIYEIAGFDGLFYFPAERSSFDDWSPLEIDRENDEFKSTVEVIEESIELIRGDY